MLMPGLMLMLILILIPLFWEFITYETVEDGLKIVEHVLRLPVIQTIESTLHSPSHS